MANYIATDAELTAVANKIRSKTGGTASLEWPDGFVSGINSISGGGSPTLETVTKSYTPSETEQTETIEAGEGYDGIESVDVTVGAISDSYVGSGITRRSSSDLTASGATVTAPAGYYESAASKSLPTQAAQTIHPSSSDQTIASGKYLTGVQTVKGVLLTNLLASIVKKDEVVKVGDADDDDCVASVTGTYEGGGSGITMVTGSVTGSGTHTLSITAAAKPDIIKVWRSDMDSMTACSDRANVAFLAMDGFCVCNSYSAASSTTITNGGSAWNVSITSTASPAANRVGYSDGKLYLRGNNNSNLWSTSLTYNYELYFLPAS